MTQRRTGSDRSAHPPLPVVSTVLLLAVAWALLGSGPHAAGRAANAPRSTTTTASSQPAGAGLDIVGQLGGFASAVTLEGGRLYLAQGPRAVVFDVSGDGEPVMLGQSPILPSVVLDLAVSGGYVFAVSRAGLSVVDAREPRALRVAAFVPSHEPTLGDGWSFFDPLLALSGPLLYFAPHPYEPVRVLDVSDPKRPIQVSTLHVAEPVRALESIAADGPRAYLAYSANAHGDEESAVEAFDLASPRAPRPLGSIAFESADLGGLAVAGPYLLLYRSSCGLEVIDASDPTRLAAIACLDWDRRRAGPRIVSHGSLAFVVDGSSLWIVDWSDPEAMELVGQIPVAASDVAIDARHGRWFVAAGSGGLRAYASPVDGRLEVRPTWRHGSVGHAQSVAVHGDVALVTGWPDELSIVDIADPASPRLLSTLALPGGADRVAAAYGFAYVATPPSRVGNEAEDGTVYVVDLADPRQPHVVQSLRRIGAVFDLTVAGGRLFLAESPGLAILDVRTEPGHPRQLAWLPSRADAERRVGAVTHVAATDRRAVIVDSVFMDWGDPRDDGEADAVRVIDVSDPSRPSEMGAAPLGNASSWSGVRGLDLDGPYAFAVTSRIDEDRNAIVHALDVAEPTGPTIAAAWPSPALRYPTSLAVDGSRVYVGSWFGIEVLDRTVATDPRPTAAAITPGTCMAAAELAVLSTGRVVFANCDAGLVVLEVDPGMPSEPRPARAYLPRIVRPAAP